MFLTSKMPFSIHNTQHGKQWLQAENFSNL